MTYAYDNCDRLTTIVANGRTTSFSYDAASRRTAATWPNNTTASYAYDAAGQLTNLVHRTSGGATIASFAYRYDRNGNPTNMLTHEGSFRFDYDAVNWLVGASYPAGRTEYFDYDNAGNRTNHVLITGTVTNRTRLTYAAANRLAQTVSGTLTNLYRYDGAGRLTNHVVAGRDRWIGYDFRGQMRSLVDTNGVVHSYEFDGDGNRRREVVGGVVRRFLYDGPNPVMELDGAGVVQAVYVQGAGIDQMIEKISYVGGVADGRYVYHADHLGSVHAITDELQATVQTYGYEAFGRVRWTTGSGPVGGNRFTYTGREPVGDTAGWYYYRWRVMDPAVGRFTSEDPLGFVDGVNVYSYVSNGPSHHTDPEGLLCCSVPVTSQWPTVPWYQRLVGRYACYSLYNTCLIRCEYAYGHLWEGADRDCVEICLNDCWRRLWMCWGRRPPSGRISPPPLLPPRPRGNWTPPHYPTRERNM